MNNNPAFVGNNAIQIQRTVGGPALFEQKQLSIGLDMNNQEPAYFSNTPPRPPSHRSHRTCQYGISESNSKVIAIS